MAKLWLRVRKGLRTGQPGNRLQGLLWAQAHIAQDTTRYSLAFQHQPQQNVLRANRSMMHPLRLDLGET